MRLRNVSISAGLAILVSSVPAQAQKQPVEKPQNDLAAALREVASELRAVREALEKR
jgi:hypothetical protein